MGNPSPEQDGRILQVIVRVWQGSNSAVAAMGDLLSWPHLLTGLHRDAAELKKVRRE